MAALEEFRAAAPTRATASCSDPGISSGAIPVSLRFSGQWLLNYAVSGCVEFLADFPCAGEGSAKPEKYWLQKNEESFSALQYCKWYFGGSQRCALPCLSITNMAIQLGSHERTMTSIACRSMNANATHGVVTLNTMTSLSIDSAAACATVSTAQRWESSIMVGTQNCWK